MVMQKNEKQALAIVAVLMGVELVTDLSIAQVPIIGDMANASGDTLLNVIQLLILGKAAKES